jgi:hypothetical protein
MHSMRVSARGVSWLVALAATVGCASGGEPTASRGGKGASRGRSPAEPVTSCTVRRDVTLSDGQATAPAIAAAGSGFAVVWTDVADGPGDVHLTVVDGAANVVRSTAITAGRTATSPAVAALEGGEILVAWEDVGGGGGVVRALRAAADGRPAGGAFTVAKVRSPEARPEITATPEGAVIGWTDASGARVAELRKDAVASPIALPGGAQLSLAGADGALGAVWDEGSALGFAPLSASGGRLDRGRVARFRSAPGKANLPRAATNDDDETVVVWEDNRGGNGNEAVFLTAIDKDDHAGAEVRVSPDLGSADTPDVALLGATAAVVYYQYRDGPPAIFLSLIDPESGRPGSDLRVSGHAAARFPRVAAQGDALGVAYADRAGPVRLALLACR